MGTRSKYYKIIATVFAFIVFCFLTTSCHQSKFCILTNNDVAYWRYENTDIFTSFSKEDSLTYSLNADLTRQKQSVWECKHGEKFRFSGDTLFNYVKDKNRNFYYKSDTLIVLSLTKNKMVFYNSRYPENGRITWNRLRKTEVSRRKSLRYTNWHNYELLTTNVMISLPIDYVEEKKTYNDGVAYHINDFDNGVMMIIAEGEVPDARDYLNSKNCTPIKINSMKGKEIFYGKTGGFNYRTDIIKNVHISYFYVRDMDRMVYDKVLDDIKCSVIK